MSTLAWLALAAAVAVVLYYWLRPSMSVSGLPGGLPDTAVAEDGTTTLQPNKDGGGFHFSFGF